MNVLIVGSGGREYSIGHALKKDSQVNKIFFAPGNGASCLIGENVSYSSYGELIDKSKKLDISLVVVGPEQPLVDGLSDMFRDEGLLVFGPSADAARLEASKSFMKSFASRHNIKSAAYIETSSLSEAEKFIDGLIPPIVVKADGLCAGKGVIIAKTEEEARESVGQMLSGDSFGDAGRKVVIEEYLDGFELSVFAISDGEEYIILPPCQDHKRLGDGDSGPNTGGMGAYAPTPLCSDELLTRIENEIVKPAIGGAKKDGFPFEGVLFCGIMVVKGEPYLLEFNVRFGDPECEVLMPLIKSSLFDLLYSCAKGSLNGLSVEFRDGYGMCVVAASKDYPFSSSKPKVIKENSPDKNLSKSSEIFYAGVKRDGDTLLASGGRVLCSVGFGESLELAREMAYKRLDLVKFEGMKYRKDIGSRAL